jgi:hypothetical protein
MTIVDCAVVVAVACADVALAPPLRAAPATVADIANYAGRDRQQVLEGGAKQEGRLTIYTTPPGRRSNR